VIAITGSRIMAHVTYPDENDRDVCEIVVWNWKTGELVRFHDLSGHTSLNLPQVFDLSRSELIGVGPKAVFLDEFRVAVVLYDLFATELAVFNTLIPQDHPVYLQRLAFPPEFSHRHTQLHVDHSYSQGLEPVSVQRAKPRISSRTGVFGVRRFPFTLG